MRRPLDLLVEGATATAAFDLTDDDLRTPVRLLVHGVVPPWTLSVDGVDLVGPVTSMFEPWAGDLRALLPGVSAGAHRVELRGGSLDDLLDATPRRPRARWRTALADDARLRFVRTSLLGHAPGFAPGPAAVGPWRPVELETGAAWRVSSLDLDVRLDGADGLVTARVGVDGEPPGELHLQVGEHRVPLPLAADGAEATVRVPAARRWWPHSHGEPATYPLHITHEGRPVDLPGDGTSVDATRRLVGFRELGNGSSYGRADPGVDSVALHLNGVPVFVRGVVWTPPGGAPGADDLAALEEAAALGFNLVRVSGLTTYASDAFHDRCAELGLLVWQDLMLATFDYPLDDESFAATLAAEVAREAARLAGRPATAVLCGSAEHEQQAAMFGVRPDTGAAGELAAWSRRHVEATRGLDAVWVDSTPCGGDPVVRVDAGVAQYFGVGGYRRPLDDVRTAGVRFAAECLAFAHLPDGAEPPPGLGVPRDVGADWDFADVREHYARAVHGSDPTLAERQRVTGEVSAHVFGWWRRPDSGCGGGIVLWLRDLTPGAGWGLLDHTGAPKPAARVLAPVLAPRALWLSDEGLNGVDVHLANDPATPLSGTLRVALLRDDGTVADEAEREVEVAGHGYRRWGVEEVLGRFADAAYAYRFGPPAHARVRATLTSSATSFEATLTVPGRR